MPTPITSDGLTRNFLPSASDADACDPNIASCTRPEDTRTSASVPPSVELDPVHVTGELGTRQLVEQFERDRGQSDCTAETRAAWLSCGNAAATAVWAAAGAATVIGAVGGVAATFVAGVNCGKDLALLDACENP